MITRREVLMGRDLEYPLTRELDTNLVRLLFAVNQIRAAWGKPMTVTSGYRPGRYNSAAGGAKKSAHLTCEAIDIADPSGELGDWLIEKVHLLEAAGLYMESPTQTEKGGQKWVHLQTRPTQNRIFLK